MILRRLAVRNVLTFDETVVSAVEAGFEWAVGSFLGAATSIAGKNVHQPEIILGTVRCDIA